MTGFAAVLGPILGGAVTQGLGWQWIFWLNVPETIVSLAAGALLAIAFVAWEGRTRAPMVPMRLFRSGAFSSGSVGIFCLNASLAGPVFLMTQFQQVALGQGPSTPVCACCPGGR